MLTKLFIKIGAFLVLVLAALGFEYFKRKKKNKPSGNIIEVPFDVNEGSTSENAEDITSDPVDENKETDKQSEDTN